MPLSPGQEVDRYDVEAVLGQGGMAVVYRVRHRTLHTLHALKVLTMVSPGVRKRLLQEGRVQAQLRHPNVVAVTDVLDVQGAPALLMEYVNGPALDQFLASQRPSLEQAEFLFRGVVEGVAQAHALGIVHRDLKPANVLLAGMVPKVTDFGLAKAIRGEPGSGHTRTGATMGTPAYMAPEQIRNAKDVDARADVFALGALLYELVTGTLAFPQDDLLELFNAAAEGRYRPPRELVPDLPEHLERALTGALEPDRERRLPSCHALLAVLDGKSSWAPPPETPLQPLLQKPMPADGPTSGPMWHPDMTEEEPAPERVTVEQPPPSQRRVSPLLIGSAVVLVLLFGCAGLALALKPDPPPETTWVPGPALQDAPKDPATTGRTGKELPPDQGTHTAPAGDPPVDPPPVQDPPTQDPPTQDPPATEPAVDPPATDPPATEPAAVPPATEPVARGKGTLRVRGDADSVKLVGPQGSFGPGPVAPGAYTIRATFGGQTMTAGTVQVKAGQTVTLECDASFMTCDRL
jgi:serine/threonine-protein kinase